MPVHGAMTGSLPADCHRAGTCRGSARAPLVRGHVPYARAYEHQRAVAVREATDDACAVSKLQGGEIVSTFRTRSELSSPPIL